MKLSGNVTYVDQTTAVSDQLTYVNGAGNAVVKVDNTTTIQPGPMVFRNSVESSFFGYVLCLRNLSLGPSDLTRCIWIRLVDRHRCLTYPLRLFRTSLENLSFFIGLVF
jgi:hypothetical protein